MRRWLVVAALAAVACSSSGPWRRIETPHFVLRTDLSQPEAKRAAAALETTRDALVSAAWPSFQFAPQKAEAYVLANGLDFERYFGKSTHGLFTRDKPPRFFLYGSAAKWDLRRTSHRPTPSVLRHEMVHQLGSEVWPHQPRWFSEGWAEFLEPIYYADDDNHVVVGALNHEALSWYRAIRTTKLTDALDWKERGGTLAEREAKGLYGISWLFVHWLFHRHPDKLGRIAEELSRGTAPDQALRIAWPNFDPADADRELFQYQKYARFARFDQNVRPLIGTPVSMASLEQRLLEPHEVEETKQVLAGVGEAHTGRSQRRDPSLDVDRPSGGPHAPRIDYTALPMLPQYPCGRDDGGGPSVARLPADGVPEQGALQPSDSPPTKDSPAARDSRSPAAGDRSELPISRQKVPSEITERVIRGADAELRACYNDGLTRDPGLGGKVTMHFVIVEDGSVSQLRTVCTSLPDAAVVSCMVERFAKFQFPKPPGGRLTVVYPIVFTPVD